MEHLDLSSNQTNSFPHPVHSNATKWSKCAITVRKGDPGLKGSKMANFSAASMSEEESKIWGELENEVERDLEDEIKDGISRLALRLHRLYQHQKTRDAKLLSNNEMFTEVNITIRIGGNSTIKIQENKKEIHKNKAMVTPRNTKLKLLEQQSRVRPSPKEFDWVSTLRSNLSFVETNSKKIEVSQHARKPWNSNKVSHTPDHAAKDRRKVYVNGINLLQVGWRN